MQTYTVFWARAADPQAAAQKLAERINNRLAEQTADVTWQPVGGVTFTQLVADELTVLAAQAVLKIEPDPV